MRWELSLREGEQAGGKHAKESTGGEKEKNKGKRCFPSTLTKRGRTFRTLPLQHRRQQCVNCGHEGLSVTKYL